MRKILTPKEKEIERNKYILKKLEKKDFFGLGKEYEKNPEGAIAFHKQELEYWEAQYGSPEKMP